MFNRENIKQSCNSERSILKFQTELRFQCFWEDRRMENVGWTKNIWGAGVWEFNPRHTRLYGSERLYGILRWQLVTMFFGLRYVLAKKLFPGIDSYKQTPKFSSKEQRQRERKCYANCSELLRLPNHHTVKKQTRPILLDLLVHSPSIAYLLECLKMLLFNYLYWWLLTDCCNCF